jgi:hypothetical protein
MTPSIFSPPDNPGKIIRSVEHAFHFHYRDIPDLKEREFGNKNNPQQFRYYFPEWEIMDNRPNDSVFYEMNHWNRYGKAEIRLDIQFWEEGFHEIGEIIRLKKDEIGQKMPAQPTIEWYVDKRNPQWGRLQYCFPDTTDPKILAQCMLVLINETKDVVNDWLISKKMRHY